MSAENLSSDSNKDPLEGYISYAAKDLGLPEDHAVVLKHARLLEERTGLRYRNIKLQIALEQAEKDPLTDYWLKGPGFRKLNEMISVVENKQDGLIDDDDTPNAIFGLGIDLEGLHYTNNFYGQEGGDARLIEASREIGGVAEILRETVRSGSDRRKQPRAGNTPRLEDILIRTGGDEFMVAFGVNLTSEHNEVDVANIIIDRLKIHKSQTIPGARIIYMGGFWKRGQVAEDFYYSVDPKADMARAQKLARPIVKIVRLGLGQYRPSEALVSEL